jgi:hypothetical protein
MKVYENIKKFLGKKKPQEYLYFVRLNVMSFEEKNKLKEQSARNNIINFIKHNLLTLHKKEIMYTDVFIDAKDMSTYLIFSSTHPQLNPFLTPLLYELYAYKAKKTVEIFTYTFETILFKINNEELPILKFTIEC